MSVVGVNASASSALVGCKHYVDGRQVPCPSMCPVQEWPESMFRLTWFRSRWVLRRRYRRSAS